MQKNLPFTGQVAFVSGASRGIGRAIAEGFAAAGGDVAINFKSHSEAAARLGEQIRAQGRRVLLLPGDVSDYAAVESMIGETIDKLGSLNVAVANAASDRRELFYEADMEAFRRAVDVTMWGALHVFRAAAQRMIEQGRGGALVGISSPHAFVPYARAMSYNMSKAALDQMAKTAALELAPHRIRVNLVHPGWTDTEGEREAIGADEIAAACEKLLWGRLARPEEIARGVLFLCDPASDYITGSSLLIDGGFTLPWWLKLNES